MIIGYPRVSTTEQNLDLQRDAVKPATDASVDATDGEALRPQRRLGRSPGAVARVLDHLVRRCSLSTSFLDRPPVHGIMPLKIGRCG